MLVVLGMVFAGAVPVSAENPLIRGISGLWAAAAYALLAVAFFGWLQAPPGWLRSAHAPQRSASGAAAGLTHTLKTTETNFCHQLNIKTRLIDF